LAAVERAAIGEFLSSLGMLPSQEFELLVRALAKLSVLPLI
jgi:hypothetical protein